VALAPSLPQSAAAQRPARRLPLFLLGIGLALFAFMAVFAIGLLQASRSAAGQEVAVIVAAKDILPRQAITPDLVMTSHALPGAVPPNPVTKLAGLSGYTAVVPIAKGQPLSMNLLTSNPDQIDQASVGYLPIPAGFVAFSIPTNELDGVAGYVAPGDYIDVIATVNTGLVGASAPRTVTRTVFTSLRVIRVGPPTPGARSGRPVGVASSLTIVVSQCDAQYIDWLLANAVLKYTLLSPSDYTPPAVPDPNCPATTAPTAVGPAQVDSRWGFSRP